MPYKKSPTKRRSHNYPVTDHRRITGITNAKMQDSGDLFYDSADTPTNSTQQCK